MRSYRRTYLIYRHCLMMLLACSGWLSVTAQTTKEEPYNRFQYHKFKWRTFHTEAFHIYFPYGNDSLCKYIATILPEAMERVKHRMVSKLLAPPNIVIYPSPDQLYESNIGIYEQGEKTLPTFVSTGNRLVLFYNGSHADVEAQLYEALVRAIWEAQMKGDITEQAKGKDDEAIPFWFSEGAIRFFAHHWPVQAEDELRRSFENNQFHNWHEVIAYQPRLSGQAFCYFLTDRFYEQAVVQLFGQLKKKKDLRRSVRLIAKKELDSLYVLCFDYYKERFSPYMTDTNTSIEKLGIPRKKGIVKTVLLDPDQKNITYVTASDNNRIIYNYNSQSGKTNKVTTYKLPPWINDYSKDQYPLLKYEGSNNLLITQPKRGKITAGHYSSSGGKLAENTILGIDGVTNIQSASNGKYLMSGYRKGQSDIVGYDANREKYTPHTSDTSDDTYLANGIKDKAYFISSRPLERLNDTIIPPVAQGIYSATNKTATAVVAD